MYEKMTGIMSSVLTTLQTNDTNTVNRARSHTDGVLLFLECSYSLGMQVQWQYVILGGIFDQSFIVKVFSMTFGHTSLIHKTPIGG